MQPIIPSFDEFLSTQSVQVPLGGFILNLLLATVLSLLVGFVYIRYGTALSNRRAFGRNFLLVAVTTMFIITVVKSSLALSLGLVGALSIVRFRTAVKDPEELAFILIAIAIGLGLGADQRAISIVATFFLMGLVLVRHRYSQRPPGEDIGMHLSVVARGPDRGGLEPLVGVVQRYSPGAALRRFDETDDQLEALFLVHLPDFEQLAALRREIAALPGEHEVAFLDPELR
jgi:uncharacterized membrane protein YhiD involved in acid resistance